MAGTSRARGSDREAARSRSATPDEGYFERPNQQSPPPYAIMPPMGWAYEPLPHYSDRNRPHRCHHLPWETCQEPCVKCRRFCFCEWKHPHPDVLVRSLDGETVRLCSAMVKASIFLRWKVKMVRKEEERKRELDDGEDCKIVMELNKCKYPVFGDVPVVTLESDDEDKDGPEGVGKDNRMTIDISDDEDEEMEVVEISDDDEEEEGDAAGTDVLDLIDLAPPETVDLREGSEPTLGIMAATLLKVQEFCVLHQDEVEAAVEKEVRDDRFFSVSFFPRPRKTKLNPFGFQEWEEEFFNVDAFTFLEIVKAKTELYIWDLHYAVEKWFKLFRGAPDVDFCGPSHRVQEDKMDDPDYEEYLKANTILKNPRRRVKRGRQNLCRYYLKATDFKFRRGYAWKRAQRV